MDIAKLSYPSIFSGTAEGVRLVGPWPHHFFAPPAPIKYHDFIPFFDFQYEKIIFSSQPSHFSPCSAVPEFFAPNGGISNLGLVYNKAHKNGITVLLFIENTNNFTLLYTQLKSGDKVSFLPFAVREDGKKKMRTEREIILFCGAVVCKSTLVKIFYCNNGSSIECFHRHAIKIKIKNHSVDKLKKL